MGVWMNVCTVDWEQLPEVIGTEDWPRNKLLKAKHSKKLGSSPSNHFTDLYFCTSELLEMVVENEGKKVLKPLKELAKVLPADGDNAIKDLEAEAEGVHLILSPKRVAKLAALDFSEAFDFLKQDFPNYRDEGDDWEAFFPETPANKMFAKVLLPYLQAWVELFQQANQEQRGIVAYYN